MFKKLSTRQLAFCGILAAVYCVVTVATAPFAYGYMQFRISEALCVLPFFAPYTTLGLFVGCVLANIFSTVSALDIVIGSAATLIACLMTAHSRNLYLALLPPVICNMLLVGALLAWVMTPDAFLQGFVVMGVQVAIGEAAVMAILGLPLALLIRRRGWDRLLRGGLAART